MWLFRGAQSAVFYYASCTPCAENHDRWKRRQDASRVQREKEKERHNNEIITDQPRPFAQPTPFSTNVGWREEIALGPGPPVRRGGHRNVQRTDSFNTDRRSQLKKDKSSGLMHPLGEKWKSMRYQREDEPLWGQQEVRGSSIGISGRGRADPNEPSKYYTPRVPPVNDLHPPIVSGPRSRAETRWMLQPPPSARVMAGKADVNSVTSPTSENFRGFGTIPPASKSAARENDTGRISEESGDEAFDDTTQNHRTHRPSLTRLSIDSDGPGLEPHSRSDSMFSTTNSDDSPSLEWKYPDTPASRPQSKATDDDDKFYRPHLSKALSTMHRDDKKVHMLHLEISDDNRDEIGLGQLQATRPWRWSMDI
ncbi:Copper/zinc superoxide dismutase (SODC) family protein [Penicillium digitatum]|uniref:Uncharacterized protein n=3 Tax=Penicillium digitatum TaxID=36651 RepID=K9FXL9_PEND2|nr:hypothetical protein PDIP_28410 [Penicillium digitatum Pd1]EKV05806.1 hypothetical protein PDIG_80030 [Penicillium digitatum PHI26]EKV18103.1 hypothetical protein PDIP_28410 [Penicillium digitatum Pd1]KAG0155034.1 hypothetical protein PDIDSM_607 [Penicillium digitatum]QQK47062.1 Copper/zinc superoxide dismutase (SODC) family protein [Penicillium digitatum]